MNVLSIDTSTSFAGVGLSIDGNVTSTSWRSRHNHGRETMPAINRLLDTASLTTKDIDVVVVALGPGGFSAVRVGIATALGLVTPSGARLIGVPTHLIQAYTHRAERVSLVVSLIPIGRNQVSFSSYRTPISPSKDGSDVGICGTNEVADRFAGTDALFCGEGALVDGDNAEIDPALVRPPSDLLAIALRRLESGEVAEELIEPIYSRPPTITAPRRT